MWGNFKSMPIILKFLTAQAVAGIMFLIGSIIPHDSFSINGQSVTYNEWWNSGVGIYVSILGTGMAIAGYLLVTKNNFSRQIYLVILCLGLVAPYLKWGNYTSAFMGMFIVVIVAGYLFLKASVKDYFASNQQRNTDSGASAPPPVR